MARIKDFAKDLGLDIKEAVELAASYGLGTKQVSGNIDDNEIAVFVRYERFVLTEIHFLAQALYHLYRRVVERHIALACFAFQFADFDFELGDVFQTIADMNFFNTAP